MAKLLKESHQNIYQEYKQNNFQSAYEQLQKLVQSNQEPSDGHKYLAFCAHRLAKYDEAVQYYTQALQDNPTDLDLQNDRAIAYISMNMHREAEADFHDLLRKEYNVPDTHYNLGLFYYQNKRYLDAIKHLQNANTQQSEKQDSIDYLLCWSYFQLNYLRPVIQLGEQLLKKYPDSSVINSLVAFSYLGNNEISQAQSYFHKSIELLEKEGNIEELNAIRTVLTNINTNQPQ